MVEVNFPCSELLLRYSKDSSLQKLEAWKIDIKEDIHEADWEMACFKAQTHEMANADLFYM